MANTKIPTNKKLIQLSTSYLVNNLDSVGRFHYKRYPQRKKSFKHYNILRHAGSIYALCTAFDKNPNPSLKNAIRRASSFLLRESWSENDLPTGIGTFWSRPEISGNQKHLAKLGGAGLGLLAMASSILSGVTVEELGPLKKTGEFILYMQKADGSFYSKFIPSQGGQTDAWTSLYYPGEAALGLLTLYEVDPEKKWRDAAKKALLYLARSRYESSSIPADHWALLATAKLLNIHSVTTEERQQLLHHAVQICRQMLSEQQEAASRFPGAFTPDGRTTPAATRLEGLQAAKTFLPASENLSKRMDQAIGRGIAFLRRSVILAGPLLGGVPRALAQIPGNSPEIQRFNKRASEVRIDYVQHLLSALLQNTD